MQSDEMIFSVAWRNGVCVVMIFRRNVMMMMMADDGDGLLMKPAAA